MAYEDQEFQQFQTPGGLTQSSQGETLAPETLVSNYFSLGQHDPRHYLSSALSLLCILPKPFPLACSIDYTIALSRPFDKEEIVFSRLELESVFDLHNADEAKPADIEPLCFNGPATTVTVILSHATMFYNDLHSKQAIYHECSSKSLLLLFCFNFLPEHVSRPMPWI